MVSSKRRLRNHKDRKAKKADSAMKDEAKSLSPVNKAEKMDIEEKLLMPVSVAKD